MVDPRIYRVGLAVVAVAVIIFGFSLQTEPSGVTSVLPPGQFFSGAAQAVQALAAEYPSRAPGSPGDAGVASWFNDQLQSSPDAFNITDSSFAARTGAGTQALTTIAATRTGLTPGTIVVVAARDATGTTNEAALSGTVVLADLAHALAGETLSRTVMLVSTSGTVGTAGAAALARSLAGQSVDAVIVLGDLAGKDIRQPVVVPWSSTDAVAPALLRQTLGSLVHAQTGIEATGPDLPSQLAHLAFPFSPTAQAPFNAAGIPAVTVSVSGDRLPSASETLALGHLSDFGNAILQTVDALQTTSGVPVPSATLTFSGHVVPLWAIRLLVLALILPVAATTVDALARARRRGHSLRRWIAWVLAGAVPFLVGFVVLVLARIAGALRAPVGAVGAAGIPIGLRGWLILGVTVVLVAAAFYLLRPVCVRFAAGIGGGSAAARRASTPAIDGAAVGLTAVMCALALVLWVVNPFAALLLVPALHLWMWLAEPRVHTHRALVVVMVVAGLVAPLLVCAYYATALGLSPVALIWSGALYVGGGGLSLAADVYWSLVLGALASALVIAIRVAPARAAATTASGASVRGPSNYAGPGSLGGTESALRVRR
jgi:hypothetical protein